MHVIIGGAGFIGTRLCAELLSLGHRVIAVDDDTTSRVAVVKKMFGRENFEVFQGNINEAKTRDLLIQRVGDEAITLWHLAANSDIQSGSKNLPLDYDKTLSTSVSVSELVSRLNCTSLNFASSSAIYGSMESNLSWNEDDHPKPISYYGISKLASEMYLTVTCDIQSVPIRIFRFANIVGSPATHGVIRDFIKKLSENPMELQVLGDGSQLKNYLHSSDLVKMMIIANEKNILGPLNLGSFDGGISVSEIASLVTRQISPGAKIAFGQNSYGWYGDVPKTIMDISKFRSYSDYRPLSSYEAVTLAIREISEEILNEIVIG
jgi:UDP-glucose 4-epimerase